MQHKQQTHAHTSRDKFSFSIFSFFFLVDTILWKKKPFFLTMEQVWMKNSSISYVLFCLWVFSCSSNVDSLMFRVLLLFWLMLIWRFHWLLNSITIHLFIKLFLVFIDLVIYFFVHHQHKINVKRFLFPFNFFSLVLQMTINNVFIISYN